MMKVPFIGICVCVCVWSSFLTVYNGFLSVLDLVNQLNMFNITHMIHTVQIFFPPIQITIKN